MAKEVTREVYLNLILIQTKRTEPGEQPRSPCVDDMQRGKARMEESNRLQLEKN